MTDARTLTLALGGRWSGGQGTACCPAHNDKNPSLSLADGSDGRLLLYCHAGCAYDDVRAALRGRGLSAGSPSRAVCDPVHKANRQDAAEREAARRAGMARNLWQEAKPIAGTLAERYLRYRGITASLPDTLGYITRCWHKNAKRLPALVCKITGSDLFAIHRTYLRSDGHGKADVNPTKTMLGPVSGGAVHLSNEGGPLVVTEGIETGLSLLSGLLDGPATVWAALSAGGMKRLRLPDDPGKLVIAADGDQAGHEAAHFLATRADAHGWQVSFRFAPDGADWNDVLTGKAVGA